MELGPDAVPDELPDHPEAVSPGVPLDGPTNGVDRLARTSRCDPLVHGHPGLDHQTPIGVGHLPHSQGDGGVAVHSVQEDGDVHVDDVTVGQRSAVGDPVADHLVDRRAHRLGVAPVVQWAGVAAPVDGRLVDDLVEAVGGDPGNHVRADLQQDLGGCRPGPTHPCHLVGRPDARRGRRTRITGLGIGRTADRTRYQAHGTQKAGSDGRLGTGCEGCLTTLPFDHETMLPVAFGGSPCPARVSRVIRHPVGSTQETADAVHHTGRPIQPLDLDGDADHGLHPARHLVDLHQFGTATDPGAHDHR